MRNSISRMGTADVRIDGIVRDGKIGFCNHAVHCNAFDGQPVIYHVFS